ncbi:MAG: LysR family transcriptional regulator, partial [Woeseiaceae bacterium]
MDKFENLQAFVTVVEAGSFTAAAERLDTAKSAISRRVSALEERLGVQLLRRT